MSEQWVHTSHLIPRERMEDLVSRGIASRSYFIQVREVVDEDQWITEAAKQEDGAMVNAGSLTIAPAWSQAAPKVPGWYWYKDPQGNRAVLHVRGASTMRVFYSDCKDEIPYEMDNYHGSWAGPLIVPPEGTR